MSNAQLEPIFAALDAIYSAAQDPAHWRTALERIASAVGGVGATLGYYGFHGTHVEFGTSTVFSDEAIDYYRRELAPEDPITPLVQNVPVGVTTLGHEVLPNRDWTASRMYAELYQPHMVLNAMAGAFTGERDRFGTIIVMQERGAPAFQREQAQRLDVLLPHLDRGLRISQFLAATRSEGVVAGRLAAVFLDACGEVLALGAKAEAVLSQTTRLTIRDRRLRSTEPQVDAWLAKLSATGHDPLPQRAVAVVGYGGPYWLNDGTSSLRLDAVPCPEPLLSWTTPGPHPAIIVLLETAPPGAGLPAALSEVAELIAEGLSDKQIAEQTGRPLATVRTYVSRLYERTGLRSRAALTKWWWTRG